MAKSSIPSVKIDPRILPVSFSDTVGVASDAGRFGVIGSNPDIDAFGFLAGKDLGFSQHAGVYGESDQQGVMGLSTSAAGTGVYGGSTIRGGGSGTGVRGETESGLGVLGRSFGPGNGVEGHSVDGSGVIAFSENGVGIVGRGGQLAGRFEGDVEVTGDIRLTSGEDCAENFDVAGIQKIEPGSVMVINAHGALQECATPYDKRVAGVVSGAGAFKPAILLGTQQTGENRTPIALLGKVECKVDASYSAIEVGDLLTTSPTRGHAMKVSDPLKAFGTVIGKALRPLKDGHGLIPILIALQ